MAMNLNTYTEKAQEALLKAQAIAVDNGNSQIDPEHLLNALLTQEGGITPGCHFSRRWQRPGSTT